MFQKVNFFDGKELNGWQVFLEELSKDNAKGIILFVAEETPFNFKQIKPLLKKLKITVWGGIFPEVIYNGSMFRQGVVGCTFRSPVSIEVIKNMDEFNGTFSKNFISENTKSLLILNDGYANNIPFLIETLYEMSLKEISFIGGGAGSLRESEHLSLFTCDDFFIRGAIIASVQDYISVGMGHGWQPIHGPAIASDVEKHTLKSIDWEPAFNYYKKVVEKDSGKKLRENNFLEIAKSYPIGLLKYDDEIVLRVLLGIDKTNNILLGSEIPKNSMLMIMKASSDEMIKAAGLAAEHARTTFETKKKISPSKALLMDCITRVLSLGDRFKDELKIIKDKVGTDVFVFGFLSLGEIASIGDKYIELHNKTVVIGIGE
jgi:hypothetical protein